MYFIIIIIIFFFNTQILLQKHQPRLGTLGGRKGRRSWEGSSNLGSKGNVEKKDLDQMGTRSSILEWGNVIEGEATDRSLRLRRRIEASGGKVDDVEEGKRRRRITSDGSEDEGKGSSSGIKTGRAFRGVSLVL